MRKLILQQFVTIDGFAADLNGGMEFQQEYAARNDKSFQADAEHFLDTVDTMILGANTYNMFVNYWPEATGEVGVFAEKLNTLSKFVVSSVLERTPWGKWESAEIIHGNPADEIAELKQKPGKDIVVWGSLMLSQSLIRGGLFDEIQLRVCPNVLGEGKKLFADELKLELQEAKTYDKGMVLLRYEPMEKVHFGNA